MLDPEAADEAREKVAGDVRQAIEGAGTLDRADVWGVRKMAYEIKQRNEADYRFYRFQGEPESFLACPYGLFRLFSFGNVGGNKGKGISLPNRAKGGNMPLSAATGIHWAIFHLHRLTGFKALLE